MKRPSLALALLCTVLALPAFAAVRKVTDPDAPRSLPADGQVDVRWTDPAGFSDLRYSGNRSEAARGDWVAQLAGHLRERAEKLLPPGERLDVEITDIRRAGLYEPWHGAQLDDVRILRDQYPPRMTLRFERIGADGRVVDAGERKLVDGAYLMRSSTLGDSDPLRYEKAMIDRWLRTELPRKVAVRD